MTTMMMLLLMYLLHAGWKQRIMMYSINEKRANPLKITWDEQYNSSKQSYYTARTTKPIAIYYPPTPQTAILKL